MIIVIIVDMEVKEIARIMKGSGVYMTKERFTLDYVRGKPNFWDNHCDLADCYLTCEDVVNRLNKYDGENEKLKEENEAFKDKLQDMGVSDFKYGGVRYSTGLCGDLND